MGNILSQEQEYDLAPEIIQNLKETYSSVRNLTLALTDGVFLLFCHEFNNRSSQMVV